MKQQTDIVIVYYYRETFGLTVTDHLKSFERYSRFQVTPINVAEPDAADRLRQLEYRAVILHYTLFGVQWYAISDEITYIIGQSNALKICFFQDEHHNCPKRFRFINEAEIDGVYTLIEPSHFNDTYFKYTNVKMLRHTLAGYVSEQLIQTANAISAENLERDIDIGYRGHELDICYGYGAREKTMIASTFKKKCAGSDLKLDVETAVDKRIYGQDWYVFLARCKGVLGVEAGVSAFDIDDGIRLAARRLRKINPDISDDQLHEQVVSPYEHNIYYRTISPRHFEAAALGTCQILFRGKYTGVMIPDVHYIPLEKDFSNLEDVLKKFRDTEYRTRIAGQAKQDLIDSQRYSYREFVRNVDIDLKLLGLNPMHTGVQSGEVS